MMSKEERKELVETIRKIHDEVFSEGYRKGYEDGLKEKENNYGESKED